VSKLDSLEILVDTMYKGDEDGFKPDLTKSEIEAIEWAYGEIKRLNMWVDFYKSKEIKDKPNTLNLFLQGIIESYDIKEFKAVTSNQDVFSMKAKQ